jgi:hypothetical protein
MKALFTSKIGLNFMEDSRKLPQLEYSIALRGAENWTLRKLNKKYIKNFEIW